MSFCQEKYVGTEMTVRFFLIGFRSLWLPCRLTFLFSLHREQRQRGQLQGNFSHPSYNILQDQARKMVLNQWSIPFLASFWRLPVLVMVLVMIQNCNKPISQMPKDCKTGRPHPHNTLALPGNNGAPEMVQPCPYSARSRLNVFITQLS